MIENSVAAANILDNIRDYPKEKIPVVVQAIAAQDFFQQVSREAKIFQDADSLEKTGAISIMRTCASSGQMKRQFYNSGDPFCKSRKPENLKYALDYVCSVLLNITASMHTETGKKIAQGRVDFIRLFLNQVQSKLYPSLFLRVLCNKGSLQSQ